MTRQQAPVIENQALRNQPAGYDRHRRGPRFAEIFANRLDIMHYWLMVTIMEPCGKKLPQTSVRVETIGTVAWIVPLES